VITPWCASENDITKGFSAGFFAILQ
jgi:hypothetical protein